MRILDKIKGKKENVLPARRSPGEGGDMVKESSEALASGDKQPEKLKEDTGRAHRILKSGHVSEKANMLVRLNRYVFKVDRKANKIEIAKAVATTYDVQVVAVNIVNTKGKSRRLGRSMGQTQDWKKAIVTLKEGNKISGLTEGA